MNKLNIQIQTENKEVISLEVLAESSKESLFEISLIDADTNGESPYQLQEGYSYEYLITKGYYLEEIAGIASPSKLNKNQGRITPGIYVGTLVLNIIDEKTNDKIGEVKLEVRSIKAEYRDDYRTMLGEITEKCTDLLLQANSPVSHSFTTDFNVDSKTLYQRFAFIKSILESGEFNDAVHKFLLSPMTKWTETEVEKDIRGIRKISSKSLRQIATSTNRVSLPEEHVLKGRIDSVPHKIRTTYKKESVDTLENRFIKYALSTFLTFCTEFRTKSTTTRLINEATLLEERLEQYLNHSVFNEISVPNILPLNSPVLQRKEGYREIFRVWLMFDLAAKLIWRGGDDVYSANKRDVAVLYEYWLFFKLLDIIKEVFQIDSVSIESLIEETKDGLGLKLKQGKYLPIKGIYKSETRTLNIEFSYNRTFSGEKEYPKGGSWTRNLRPDYTLSIWPFGIGVKEAEEEELIVHIHFDAKYRVEDLINIFGSDEVLDEEEQMKEEKEEQSKGTYKRADLLKMHTYRDAIRRTAGAYVLYPGTQSKKLVGFHELLPGLGAFAIRPLKADSGITELKLFLYEVVNHFLNRASQREKMALKTYEVHKDKKSNDVKEALPEAIGTNRSFNPDETYVLVAFYKSQEHLDWILKNKLYNARTGSTRGSLRLSPKETGARYLLLHTTGETKTNRLYKLTDKGPRIFSKQDMINRSYPEPNNDLYLVYDIEGAPEDEFNSTIWDITKLTGYQIGHNSSLPFSVSITVLSKSIMK